VSLALDALRAAFACLSACLPTQRALAERQIRGLPANLQVLHVEQEVVGSERSVLEEVLACDTERSELLQVCGSRATATATTRCPVAWRTGRCLKFPAHLLSACSKSFRDSRPSRVAWSQVTPEPCCVRMPWAPKTRVRCSFG
jgi:hypothetical protein